MCLDLLEDPTPKEERRDTTVTHANDNLDYGKVFINTFGNEGKPAVTSWNFKVTSKWNTDYFRVFVNDILHFSFKHKKYIGMQTWMDGEKVIKYCIEISLENTPPLLLEYDMPEKWKLIINEIDKNQSLF